MTIDIDTAIAEGMAAQAADQQVTLPFVTVPTDNNNLPHGVEVLCPECPERGFANAGYVHFQSPIEHITDDYTCPTGERGSWVDVPMWCEGGHHFHFVIAFHKGCTYMHIVAGEPEYYQPDTGPLKERI